MAVTITIKGTDLKIDKSGEINYYPVDDVRQRAIGTTVELYLSGSVQPVESFNESEFVSPSGTAEQISDAISDLSKSSGVLISDYWVNQAIANIKKIYGDIVTAEVAQKDLLKFGRNKLVNTSKSTLMHLPPGIDNENYILTNGITTISSSNALDTEDLIVEGHTIAGGVFTFVVQSATLNGQNQVVLSTPLARVSRVINDGIADLVGEIYVYENDTTTAGVPDNNVLVHLIIDAGLNNSEKAATTMSDTEYWIITGFYADCLEKTSTFGTIYLEIREKGKTFINKVDISATSNNRGNHSFMPYLIVPKNADVRIRGLSSAVGKDFSGGLQGILLGKV